MATAARACTMHGGDHCDPGDHHRAPAVVTETDGS